MFGWQEILDFWFGELDEIGLPDEFHRNRWFRASKSFDQEMRRRFLSMTLIASEGGLEHWRKEPGGTLAELLLLDQFTRNIYRGSSLAFGNDKLALRVCKQAMDKSQDVNLPSVYRGFFYMPLQHSERLEDHELAIERYEQLVASSEGILKTFLESFLESARDHQEIIHRFGRFPHRNQALKRSSSTQEQAYLAGNGKRFGQ
ncbi:MAG: DUF924 family protein [Marinobacter sp.]|uniref:DUF924 family protein n=1 Tax=Marinobacter sp. TaxID=50741 RepID=UPI0034A00DAB